MAANYELMIKNLLDFYDFGGKTIVCIGAGGGQFIGYGRPAARIIAIDQDKRALESLEAAVEKSGMSEKYEFILCDFLATDVSSRGDAALFEFCLHEMADPAAALRRASNLADDVVIIDHGLKSEWAYYVVEEEKVRASWQAAKEFNILRRIEFADEQKFRNYDELLAKVLPQGDTAVQRIAKFKNKSDISIPFTYELALISFNS